MKTKVVTIVGLILAVLGTAIGIAFGGFGADIAGMATVLLGAGAAIFGLWKNRNPEKPKWLSVLTVVLVSAGALIAGLSGFHDEGVFGDIIGAVILVVTTIVSIFINKKKKPAVEANK